VERLWGTLEDRLVSELRLAGAATLTDANEILTGYLPRHDGRFSVPPADPMPAWQAWDLVDPVEAVFRLHYPRRVANDATVGWQVRALALPRPAQGSWARRRVTLEHRLDGSCGRATGASTCRPSRRRRVP
jgi:hypothetical protein